MGLDPKFLDVHLVQKGSNIHDEHERRLMLEKKPSFIIVLDQGSRGGPSVTDDNDAKSLIIDHHLSDEFPENATVSVHLLQSAPLFLCVSRWSRLVITLLLPRLHSSPMRSAKS